MYLLALLGVILVTGYTILVCGFSGGLLAMFDVAAVIMLVLLIVPMLFASGLLKDFNKAFRFIIGKKKAESLMELKRAKEAVRLTGKVVVAGSAFVSFLQGIIILYTVDEPSALGPNFAVLLLTVVYGLAVRLLLLPMESILNVKIQEFISEEE